MSGAYRTMMVGEVLFWNFEWADILANGETLTASSAASVYGPTTGSGLTLASDSNSGTQSQVKITANARGHYVVTGSVTTSAGQTEKQSLEIRVTDSP